MSRFDRGVRDSSNIDGFEKFLRKLCTSKGGWDSMSELLQNAQFLQGQLSKIDRAWPEDGSSKMSATRSGKFLLDTLNNKSSDVNETSVKLDYLREKLADFGIHGFKLTLDGSLGVLS